MLGDYTLPSMDMNVRVQLARHLSGVCVFGSFNPFVPALAEPVLDIGFCTPSVLSGYCWSPVPVMTGDEVSP